jgi:predicted metalloprotease with PDZ domain
MKRVSTLIAGLAFLGLSTAAHAQDKETLKKDILREVEKRLRMEEEKILKDIEKVIDEKLGKSAPATKPAPLRKARGYIGIRSGDLSNDEKEALGIKSGIKIVDVVPDGPAAKAGLQAGDVLTMLDGRAIDSPQEIPPIIQAAGPGAKMKVDYLRAGKKLSVQVTLAHHPQDAETEPPQKEDGLRERIKKFMEKAEAPQDRPKPKADKPEPKEDDSFGFDDEMFDQFRGLFERLLGMNPDQFFEKGDDGKYRLNDELREMFKNFDLEKLKGLLPQGDAPEPTPAPKKIEPKAVGKPWLGLQPEDLSDELRAQLDIEEGVGLLVSDVLAGSPAEKAGIRKNDILVKINGKPAKGEEGLAQFMQTAKVGQEATLTILRKAREQTVKVTLGERKE